MPATRDPHTGKFVNTSQQDAEDDLDRRISEEMTKEMQKFDTDEGTTIVTVSYVPANVESDVVTRTTLTGKIVNEGAHVPFQTSFGERDYLAGDVYGFDNLDEIGYQVVDKRPRLMHLRELIDAGNRVDFLWGKKAPVRAEKVVLGECKRVTGRESFYTGFEWVVIVYADACMFLTNEQLEALVYHELRHITYDTDKEQYKPIGHDAELFFDEMEHYGLWRQSLVQARDAFVQLRIDDESIQ